MNLLQQIRIATAVLVSMSASVVQVESAMAAEAAKIEEVVVTAERRESNLQQTPIAITAMDSKTLIDRGIVDFEGVIKATPSMSFTPYPTTSNTLTVYMRGSGVQDVGQITVDPAIGLYQDGFYIARPQLITFDLADIERVEVLRGPQGTLYGRNTTGGAINLISKKPTGEFGFKQELGFGSEGRFRSLTAVDLPKVGELSSKISILKRKRDGYVRNRGSGHDFGEEEQTAGRVALRWTATDAFTADYFYERGDLDSTAYYYTNEMLVGVIPGYKDDRKPEKHTYRPIDLPLGKGEFSSHGLTLTWDVSDTLTLRSLTGYRDISTIQYQDYAEAFLVGFQSKDDIAAHQYSQELQALGSLFDGRLQYVAGLFHFKETGGHSQNIVITNVFPGDLRLDKFHSVRTESKSNAFFAQLTWTPPVLEDRLELTFGGRYTKDKRKASRKLLNTYFGFPIAQEPAPGLPSSNDLDSSEFNPSFTANYAWNEDINTYLRVATGYKAGGSSESSDVGQFGITFDPEKVKLFEFGLKSYLFDRHVRLNLAAFRSKYKDMQIFFSTNPSDLSVSVGMNAGEVTIDGLEIESLWQPFDDFAMTLEYAYLDASYDKVPVPAGTIFDPAVNGESPYRVGQDIKRLFATPYAPKNTIDIGARWTFLHLGRIDVTGMLNYRWEDRTFHSSGAGPGVPNYKNGSRSPYSLWDGRISLQSMLDERSTLRVDIWGKNLTDKKWPLYRVSSGGPVDTRDSATGAIMPAGLGPAPTVWAERRSYGVDFIYEY